jgi:hypothetical protein
VDGFASTVLLHETGRLFGEKRGRTGLQTVGGKRKRKRGIK